MPTAGKRSRPLPPAVGGLDALLGEHPSVPSPESASSVSPPAPDGIQPRRRGDLAADREVKFFAYLSTEDDSTLRRLAETWQCSRSEVLRVLVRRAKQLYLQ